MICQMGKRLATYVFIFSISLAVTMNSVAAINPIDLRCEYLINPKGIHSKQPRLSWKLISTERDQIQSAYEIIVASNLNNLNKGEGDLWESGLVESDQSHLIEYEGKELASRQVYYWKVRVRDGSGDESSWSDPASWEMGLTDKSDWQADWIGGGDIRPDRKPEVEEWREQVLHNKLQTPAPVAIDLSPERREQRRQMLDLVKPAVILKKQFSVEKSVKKARLYSSALGFYELYLNGEKISDRVLDPGQTDYESRALYNIDILDTDLETGKQTLAILLAEGWYGQSHGFFVPRLRYGDPLAIAQLEIEYEDGSSETVATDTTWTVKESPIAIANLYSGEVYDGRINLSSLLTTDEEQGLKASGPIGDQPLPKTLEPQFNVACRKVKEIKPVSIASTDDGKWIVDMGQNFAGWISLRLEAEKGTVIDLRFSELLDKQGNMHVGSIGSAATGVYQYDRYICSGEGKETWEPRFTFHGFRYVEISGMETKPDLEDIVGYLVRSDVATIGHFASSDPILDRVHDTIKWTYESNLQSVPTDCPHREKCSWLGDAHNTVEMTFYNYDMFQFWRKYIRDIQTSSDKQENGIPGSIAPGKRQPPGTFDWGVATVFIPWFHYQYTGDFRTIQKHYPYMKRFMEASKAESSNWIITNALGDWYDAPDSIERSMQQKDGSPFHTSPKLSATLHFYFASDLMSRIAKLVGNEEDEKEFASWKAQLSDTISDTFFNFRNNNFGSQTANALAIAYGLPSPDRVDDVARMLALDVSLENNGNFNVGAHGATYLYKALTDFGYGDVAYNAFQQEDYPSFKYMFSLGATTLFEAMSRFDVETGTTVKSLSHPFHGGFDNWFYESVAGIRIDPIEPAFKKLIFNPQLTNHLDKASGEVNTPYGTASSSWNVHGDTFTWNVEIPVNTSARLVFPREYGDFTESENPVSGLGKQVVLNREYEKVLELGSGSYSFVGKH